MAINKNFVVKNGIEVNTNLIVADTDSNKVGIGTTVPEYTLHVFQGTGIGATTINVTGVGTFLEELNVGLAGTTLTAISNATLGIGGSVGVGTDDPGYLLEVHSPVTTGQTALYVRGDAEITGDINLTNLSISQLNVTGLSTFVDDIFIGTGATVGFGSTAFFKDSARAIFGNGEDLKIYHTGSSSYIENQTGTLFVLADTFEIKGSNGNETHLKTVDNGAVELYYDNTKRFNTNAIGVEVSGTLQSTGITTLASSGGITTTGGDLYVGGDLYINEDIVLDTNLEILGIATIGSIHVTGISTFDGEIRGPNLTNSIVVGTGLSVRGSATGVAVTLAGAGGITTTGGDLYVGGDLYINEDIVLDTNLTILGIATIGSLNLSSTSGINTIDSTVQSSSKDTGSLVLQGGLGIEKQLYVGAGASVGAGLTVAGNLLPEADGTRDLGASGTEWKDLYIDGTANIDALIADTAKISDLSANRVVYSSAVDGELSDSANLTFDDTTLAVNAIFDSNDTTQSTSKDTGSAKFAGGVGIAKQLYVGAGASVGAGLTVKGNLLPEADGTRDLGASGTEWKDLYIDGTANIDSLSADTAAIGDLTDNQVVIAGSSGELEGDTDFTFDGTKLNIGVGVATISNDGNASFVGTVTVGAGLSITGISTFHNAAIFGSTGYIQVPAGNTAERTITGISVTFGQVRYNTQLSQFEGYGAGEAWGSLGGVKDVDGDTFIRAESAAGQDEDKLEFLTADSVRLVVDSSGRVGIGSTLPATELDLNGSAAITGIATIKQLQIGQPDQVLVGITTILDEDNMVSDSAAALATQQSIKKYVDDQVTAQDLDVAGDSGTGSVDLDSQSLTIAGTNNEIQTSASSQTLTIGLPNDVTIGQDLTVTRNLSVTGTDDNILGNVNTGSVQLDGGLGVAKNVTIGAGLSVTNKLTTTSTGIAVSNGSNVEATIVGPPTLVLDPSVIGDNTGVVRIKGDLFVDGTQTQINSTTLEISDFIVGIATTATTDTLADGAGITIGPDNNLLYENSSTSLKSSENLNVATGKAYQVNGTSVLNATTLGSNVVTSSLTTLGTIATGVWNGTAITNAYIANSTMSVGGVTLTLGGTSATPAFDLTSATNYPTSSLTGTITNAQLAGSIAASKLAGSIADSKLSTISTADKVSITALDIDGGTDIGADIVDADLFIIDDGAGGTNRKVAASRIKTYIGTGAEVTTTSVSTTSATSCGSFVLATYRSASVIAQITQGTSYQVGRYLLIHDGTTVTTIEESAIATGDMLGTFEGVINGSNVEFRVTMDSASSATVITNITTIAV